MATKSSLSKITRVALKTLGEMIKIARTERGLSQSKLAERLNISRFTVMALEKGNATVAIGIVLEAAYILGIPLLAEDELTLMKLKHSVVAFASILPKRVRLKKELIDNNF